MELVTILNPDGKDTIQSVLQNLSRNPTDCILISSENFQQPIHKEILGQSDFLRKMLFAYQEKMCDNCSDIQIHLPFMNKRLLMNFVNFLYHGKICEDDPLIRSETLEILTGTLGFSSNFQWDEEFGYLSNFQWDEDKSFYGVGKLLRKGLEPNREDFSSTSEEDYVESKQNDAKERRKSDSESHDKNFHDSQGNSNPTMHEKSTPKERNEIEKIDSCTTLPTDDDLKKSEVQDSPLSSKVSAEPNEKDNFNLIDANVEAIEKFLADCRKESEKVSSRETEGKTCENRNVNDNVCEADNANNCGQISEDNSVQKVGVTVNDLDIIIDRFSKSINFQMSKLTSSKSHLKEPRMSTKDRFPKIFECSVCTFESKSRRSLQEHIDDMHNCFRCSICFKDFSSNYNRNAHVSRVHVYQGYRCLYCLESYKGQSGLMNHVKSFHRSHSHEFRHDYPRSYFDSYTYLCKECPQKTFHSKESAFQHISAAHFMKL